MIMTGTGSAPVSARMIARPAGVTARSRGYRGVGMAGGQHA
jgi:hypothetical protein